MLSTKRIKFKVMKKLLFLFISICYIYFLYGEIGISLGWPYLGIKYNFNKKIGTELRLATLEGINVFAGRGYLNFLSTNKLKLFSGFEIGYITFDTMDTKGVGYEAALFLGGEYFVLGGFSLSIDLSPTFIIISSDNVSVDGVEIVTNFALNYYFGKLSNK